MPYFNCQFTYVQLVKSTQTRCVQQHRNAYSLISNAFYQADYIDPLELLIPESRRLAFTKAASNNKDIINFHGVEVDLRNWIEHVEAEQDESGTSPSGEGNDPHLINAYAKFRRLPSIEVAYVKDQNGKILGFDSFSTRNEEFEVGKVPKMEGECTFQIIPGETTSVRAYAVHRGGSKTNDDGAKREDYLFATSEILLPGVEKTE